MDPVCGFDGNGDIYGLGARVGIYLQWLTSILAENVHEPAVESTRDANTTFQVAMFAGFILVTADGYYSDTRALEGFVAMLFCFASAWIASLQAHSRTKAGRDGTGSASASASARGVGDLLLCTAICSYGVWFLFVGLDTLPRTPCPETVFFFAPVQLFGGFRTLLKATFVASLAGSALLIAIRSALLLRSLHSTVVRWGIPATLSPRHTELVRTIPLRGRRLVGGIAALATFIIAVELTVAWNQIRGVDTCASFSQLFPLVVGSTNLFRVVYQLLYALVLGVARVG